jgi:alpha-tubulin suppressor-like RCC1 family protein
VQVSSLTGIITVSTGAHHSLFVKNDGTAWACGYNVYGQLGDGTTTDRWTPVQVNSLTGITAVASGPGHSLFMKNDGTAWACGSNWYGQLGDGTNINRNTPVQVTGLCPLASGLEEEVNEAGFSVYPNPSSGIFQLTVDNLQSANSRVEIYNVLGEKIKNIPLNVFREGGLAVDLSHQPAGVYFVRLATAEGHTASARVVKR